MAKKDQEGNLLLAAAVVIAMLIILAIGGYLAYQGFSSQKSETPGNNIQQQAQDKTAGRQTYKNDEYGFEMTFPDSWLGYSVVKSSWEGRLIDGDTNYSGAMFVFKNPKTTAQQQWQDIPVMVIAPDVWKLIQEGKIAVSAAPIGPGQIGENPKYVFATPPRWYGFTDAIGWQEAVEIVKTFKAF